LNNSTPGLSNFLWDDQSTNPGRVVRSGGTYYLIAQDANGCFSSDTIIITQNPLPIVDLGNDRDICPRDNVVLTGGNSQMNAYLWDDRSTAMNRTVSYAGTYWVQVTDPNGCQNSDTVRITSPGQPSGSMSVYDRSGGRYDFSIMNAYNVQSYIWDFGDGSPQATGSNVSHAYSSNGNYVVRVTLQGVCPNQVVQLQHQLRVRTVGMEDIQNTLGVKLVPNPFRERFSLLLDSDEQFELEVQVMDMLGRTVFSGIGELDKLNKSLHAKSPNWLPGMYVMKLQNLQTKEQGILKINKSK